MNLKYSFIFAGCLLASHTLAAQQVEIKTRVTGSGALEPAFAIVDSNESLQIVVKPAPGHKIRQVSGCNGQYQAGIFVIEQPKLTCVVDATFIADDTLIQGSTTAAAPATLSTSQVTPTNNVTNNTVTNNTAKTRSMLKFIMVAHQMTNRVTVTAQVISGLGTVLPAMQQIQKDSSATITATAANGYAIQSISGCGVQSASSPLVIPKVSASCVVSVAFTQLKSALWDNFNWDQANWG